MDAPCLRSRVTVSAGVSEIITSTDVGSAFRIADGEGAHRSPSSDELFDDPDAFLNEAEGQPAIAADSIEVLQEQAES